MNQSKGTIYFRDNAWYKMENVIKMGISSFVKNRSNGYITGEIERGEYIYVIEIPLDKMKILDKCLKMYFKSYHIYRGGGTEFYNRCIIDLIEPYLQNLNMEYRIFTKEEIQLLNRCERVTNIPNVNKVKNIFNQLNVNHIIEKYKIKNMSLNSPYYCNDCNCSFKRKENYEKHLITTKHKNRASSKHKKTNLYICSVCSKYFSHGSSLSRHKVGCNTIKTDLVDTLQKENEELCKKIELLTNNKNNTTTNNNNIIQINCFGNENIDYITDKFILDCISKINESIPLLIEKIHFDPEHLENNNIQITNKKLPHINIINHNKEWQIVQRKPTIKSMIDNGYNLLDEKFQEKSHELADNKQKHFRDFQAKYEDGDKKTIKDIKERVELLVINNSRK